MRPFRSPESRGGAAPRLLALQARLQEHFVGRLATLAARVRRQPPEVSWRAAAALAAGIGDEPDLTPEDLSALFYLRGVIRRRQGREAEADVEFERAVSHYSNAVLNRRAILELLRHYALSGQPERVAELTTRFFGEGAATPELSTPEEALRGHAR